MRNQRWRGTSVGGLFETMNEVGCIHQGKELGRQGKTYQTQISMERQNRGGVKFLEEGVLTISNIVKGNENKH